MLGSKLGSLAAHLPIRPVGVLPPALAVWWKRSVKLGIFTHCAMNLLGGDARPTDAPAGLLRSPGS